MEPDPEGRSMSNHADRIRSHVADTYVAPARRRGDETVTVVARNVLHDLKLRGDRAAAVCDALHRPKFCKNYDLELVRVDGPPSKQSTTTTFTFRIRRPSATGNQPARGGVWDLRGVGKATFAALGGGEQWLLREREAFHESSPGTAVRERAGGSD